MDGARGSLLIAAVSGRALASAAVDADCVPLVADFFADTDTQGIAHACIKLPTIERGFQKETLMPALNTLASEAPSPVLGVVYGSGFEDRPDLLAHIAERWPVLGNAPQTVETVKDPDRFFSSLDALAIPHPKTAAQEPSATAGWLVKRRGGAGGGHVQRAECKDDREDVYYQALAAGRAISALFVADGAHAHVLGFSEQWTAPTPNRPWRYGGALQPASIPQTALSAMTDAVCKLTSTCGLIGLASADFVLGSNAPLLLELNPRPGATLDIFAGTFPLRLHLDAVLDAALPEDPRVPSEGRARARASAILYAPQALTIPFELSWPPWVADIPHPGERIDKHRPICTVLARAGLGDDAKTRVEARLSSLLARLQGQNRARDSSEE